MLGRQIPPFDSGASTLMEYASAAMGRALEIQKNLHRDELDGLITKGDPWYRFRTGELRDYIELFKVRYETGERRAITERTMINMEYGSI